MNKNIDISIIVAVYNEEKSLSILCDELRSSINLKYNWELIFIASSSFLMALLLSPKVKSKVASSTILCTS